jgi:hypothetical protein
MVQLTARGQADTHACDLPPDGSAVSSNTGLPLNHTRAIGGRRGIFAGDGDSVVPPYHSAPIN